MTDEQDCGVEFLTKIKKQLSKKISKCKDCKQLQKQFNSKSLLKCDECNKINNVMEQTYNDVNDEVIEYFVLLTSFPSYEEVGKFKGKLNTFCSSTLSHNYHNLRNDYLNKFNNHKIHFLMFQTYIIWMDILIFKQCKYKWIKTYRWAILGAISDKIVQE